MQGLGDTVAMLARRRGRGGVSGGTASDSLTSTKAFGANPGGLRMLSYCPTGVAPDAALIVVLHGCGQNAREYASGAGWLTLADRIGCAVLAPEQRAENNPNRCFNWFSPQHVSRGGGEVASIAAMIAFMLRTHDLDPARVFVTGLSAGGAMTMAMLATYPDLFAGGAVIAGLPYGVAQDVMQAMSAMRQVDRRSAGELRRLMPANPGSYPRLAVWHGESDHVVASANAEAIVAQWAHAQGLATAPSQRVVEGSRTRSVWRRAGSDEPAIELNLVRGLGHGVPLSTLGEQGVGSTAPYMLEAGLCSSTEIVKFWGLSPARGSGVAPASEPEDWTPSPPLDRARVAQDDETAPGRDVGAGLGGRVLASLGQRVPADVQDVIARAFRSAGLK